MSDFKALPVCSKCWSYDDALQRCTTFNEASIDCPGAIYDFNEYTEGLEACVIYSKERFNRNYGYLISHWESAYRKAGIPIPKEKIWMKELGMTQAYREDCSRGGGSHSEGSNKREGINKDNRAIETIPTEDEKSIYKEELKKFEETFGELERLSRSLVSNSKSDSYTGDPIE